MIAPVGHACWHGAATQCLHTSLIISQRTSCCWSGSTCRDTRPFPLGSGGWLSANCSTNFTWRQDVADSSPVLSQLFPVQANPSAGSWFHCLHATSHALHPMHTVVSV